MIKQRGAFGFIDTTGAVIVAPVYTSTADFFQGLSAVRKGDKWGYIDKNGNVVIDIKFDFAGNFSVGVAAVKVGSKFGYIGLDGNFIITPEFDHAYMPDANGNAEVGLNKRAGVLSFHY